jgi:hypothetical protein
MLETSVKVSDVDSRRQRAIELVEEILHDLENVNINAIVLKATRIVDIIKQCKADIAGHSKENASFMGSLIKKWCCLNSLDCFYSASNGVCCFQPQERGVDNWVQDRECRQAR